MRGVAGVSGSGKGRGIPTFFRLFFFLFFLFPRDTIRALLSMFPRTGPDAVSPVSLYFFLLPPSLDFAIHVGSSRRWCRGKASDQYKDMEPFVRGLSLSQDSSVRRCHQSVDAVLSFCLFSFLLVASAGLTRAGRRHGERPGHFVPPCPPPSTQRRMTPRYQP